MDKVAAVKKIYISNISKDMRIKDGFVASSTVSQMLALVRTSLWQTFERGLLSDALPLDWNEIGKLAMQQTVGPLVFDAAMRLPKEQLPPKEWIFKAYSIIYRNRQTHSLLDSVVAESCAKLSAEGIRAILLKGQAYAQVYPDPTLRQCGDIDLYVGEKNFRDAYMVANNCGWESEEKFLPNAKHYGCIDQGVRIELHRIAGELRPKASNLKFQHFSHEQLQFARTVEIGGEKIYVPTPTFDVVFVFMHLYLHFLGSGIGLRHVCDWTMLLHSRYREIDVNRLEKLLKDFNLYRGWCSFTPIAVTLLGLPENECPFYSQRYERRASRILNFIIKEGNFGRSKRKQRKKPERYLARKMQALKSLTSQYMGKLIIDPEIVLRTYIRSLRMGSKGIIYDLLGKK